MKIANHNSPNAITQRLDKLSALWQQFLVLPQAKVCRWFVEEDEMNMIDTFIGIESDESPHFIFELNSPITKAELYSRKLSEELSELIEGIRPDLQAEGFPINWYAQYEHDRRNTALGFIQNINTLPYGFNIPKNPAETEGVFVFYLKPPILNKEFEIWLDDVLHVPIDGHIRFIIVERKDAAVLDKFSNKYTGIVHTIQPQLDMPAALRQLAAAGNPADPGVKYRKAFVELSQAAARLDIDAVNKLSVTPLSIATENNWMPMQVAVYALKGNTLLNVKRYNEALQVYEQAYHLAAASYAQGDEVGGILTVQLLFGKATVYISMKNFKEAAEIYHQAAQRCEVLKDYFQVMEARRMQGFSYQQMSKPYEAWDAYHLALNCAEQLDTMTLENSTFPYIGQALMDLAEKLGKKQDYFRIEETMKSYIGEKWKDKILKR
jgi:tetratricopeptide (TPR) repeat protein